MVLNDYLNPVELDKPEEYVLNSKELFNFTITVNTANVDLGDLSNYNMAIVGVPEDRNSPNKGSAMAPEKVRIELYKLISPVSKLKIVDLGNIKPGNTYTDTYFALKEVVYQLLCDNLTIIIIGGTQDLTIPAFNACENYKNSVNLAVIDSRIDLNKDALKFDSASYLIELLPKKNKLFKFVNVGHQAYLTEKANLELVSKLFHDAIRLGEVRGDLKKIEPLLRDSDIVSFDIGSVRQADAPGHYRSNPNGFYSEEGCQIARYAGLSDMVRVLGIFETNARLDNNNQTAALAAQMIWHFIDGLENRIIETPGPDNNNFKTFIVAHTDLDHDMTFYKSMKTDRWWLEVPNITNSASTTVSCSIDDYHTACNHEVPDIWWKTFQKMG
ncbi:MAG: formimidoylglutamase [Bacteroidales bacterium]|nr:formimidoylglutamase [Bacteroidales bacterium]